MKTIRIAIMIAVACFTLTSCDQATAPKPGEPEKNADSSLSALGLSAGTLNPAFATAKYSYTASVPNATAGVTVTPTATASSATIEVRVNSGAYEPVASGSASSNLALNNGTNTIDVKVTAQNGNATTYTVTVTRAFSADTSLSALALSSGTLTPAFAVNVTAYAALVSNETSAITVTPTATASSATIEVRANGGAYEPVASGTASSHLALNIGANTVDVLVIAQNGNKTTYIITVTRMSSDSSLSALTLSAGTLSPSFATATHSYSASVPGSTSSVTVTPTATAPSATIAARANSGAYEPVASGSASSPLALNVGTNTIDVRVTAQNGTATTYTVTVTRAQSAVSSLSALALSAGTLSPSFATATHSYSASVANATTGITVTPTATEPSSTIEIRVNGGAYEPVASGSASSPLALNVGTNTIDVRVTAQNGTATTYSVTVNRIAANPQLTLDFKYGDTNTNAYANIYVAWIEKMDGTVIQNLAVCNRLLGIGGGLTNTALPFWKFNKYDAQDDLDAVTGATKKKTDFTVTSALISLPVTKFKIYFETDRSFDGNDWFDDQPALLYSAVVDLSNPQSKYDLTLEAWTPNEGTDHQIALYFENPPAPGDKQTNLKFITHKKDPSSKAKDPVFGAADDPTRSATCFVGSITLTVK